MSLPNRHRCLFVLSGEHATLPLAELSAILEAEGYKFSIQEQLGRIVIIEVDPKGATRVPQRSGLVNYAQQILFETAMDEKIILQTARRFSFVQWIPSGTRFGVQVTRVRPESTSVDVLELQRELGSCIWRSLKGKVTVDLDTPEVLFLGVIFKNRFFFGKHLASRDRRGFFHRRSPRRPFFVPSALHPKIARLMVNLSRVVPGDVILDPFCGTGGFLLEAATIGCIAIGLDVNHRMLSGCQENLNHYDVTSFIAQGDTRSPPIRSRSIDAIATDPPYGRTSSTKGVDITTLIQGSLILLAEVLKPGGHLCFAVPLIHYHEDLVNTKDFSIVETHTMRIHRSLSRHILVLKRK